MANYEVYEFISNGSPTVVEDNYLLLPGPTIRLFSGGGNGHAVSDTPSFVASVTMDITGSSTNDFMIIFGNQSFPHLSMSIGDGGFEWRYNGALFAKSSAFQGRSITFDFGVGGNAYEDKFFLVEEVLAGINYYAGDQSPPSSIKIRYQVAAHQVYEYHDPEETFTVTITPVNDALVFTPTAPHQITVTEDQGTAFSVQTLLPFNSFTDADLVSATSGQGAAITGTTGAGTWEYRNQTTGQWVSIGAVSDSSALLLSNFSAVRFIGTGGNGGTGVLTYRAWEDYTIGSGTEFTKVNTGGGGGTTFFSAATNTLTYTSTELNDAPVITTTAPTLTSINEDNTTNNGHLVSSFLASTDADLSPTPLKGIAIIGQGAGNGHWQYSTDNGANWADLGAVSNTSAFLLLDTDRIRFVPDEKNGTTATLTYRAWDQTTGTAHTLVNTGSGGGTTAFSGNTGTATITVTPVNDESGATGLTQSFAVDEEVTTAPFQIAVTDVDIGDTYTAKLTIADPSLGSLSSSGGGTYTAATGVWTITGNLATVNAALDAVKFVPTPNRNGTTTIATHIEDAGGLFPKDGTITITVNPINDAPVLAAASPALTGITEDDTGNPGQTVGSFASAAISDADAGDPKGIAITGHTDGNGHWEYRLHESGTWMSLDSSTAATALLLRAEDFIRFVPNEKNATSGTLTYRAWDQTSTEQAGETADTTTNGGATAFNIATNTASIAVSDVDDIATVTTTNVVTTESKLASPQQFHIASKVTIVDPDAYDAAHPTKYVQDSAVVTDAEGPQPPDGTLADLLTVDPYDGTVLYDRSAFRWLTGDQHVTYTITFRVQSGDDAEQETSLTVTINGQNDAPVLATPNHQSFAGMTEDDAPGAARTVASFRGSITDGDPDALTGIAITETHGNGKWQYSVDNGATWHSFVGSDECARLLADTDLLRFKPDGKNGGEASFTYRAWDQTDGTHGGTADATVTGGATAFSNKTDVVTLAVTSINDAPVMTPDHMELLPITEDDVGLADNPGQPVWQFLCDAIGDVDYGAVEGIALTGTTNGNGFWQYSLDGGTTWASVGTVGEASALLLKATDYMRFVPDEKNGTSATLTYHAWDQTTGTHGTSVDLTVTGATGGTTAYSTLTDTVSIEVCDVNDAPVVSGPVVLAAMAEDSGTRLITQARLLGKATDVDTGAQLVAADLQLVGSGTLTDNHDGTWTFKPALDDDTSVSFTYTVTDGFSTPVAATATLDLTPVNDAPVAQDNNASGNEDTAITGTVAATDVDDPTNTLTFALVGANGGALHGTVTLNATTGAYVYTPAHDFSGTDSFSYKASDGRLQSAAASVSITVNPVNDAPVITSGTPLSVAENQKIIAALVGTDVDGPNAVALSITGGADMALFDIVSGNLVFRNARDYETDAHSYVVEISAFDGVATTVKTITVNLTDVNDNAPQFTSNASAPDIVPENIAAQTIVYTAAAGDADGTAPANTVAYSLIGDDAALFSIDPVSGKIRFLASPDYEKPKDLNHDNNYQVVVEAKDGVHYTTQNLTVTVTNLNDAPVAVHGTASGEQIISGQLVASDADSPSLTCAMVTGPSHGTLTLKPDGTFSYAAALGFRGTDSFSFKANDGALDSNIETFDLNVTQLRLLGTGGNDSYTAVNGNERIDAGGGIDTVGFNFKLTDATISWVGNQVNVDTASSHTVLTGFEVYTFTDGTVNNNDGNPLVDDLYYYSHNRDVWNAHVDADAHYNSGGWRENRDPSAYFDTSFYLALNPTVKAAGVNPLTHFDQNGWKEGRMPSLDFDGQAYLAANPDVKAAGIDPLAHYLGSGAQEGRKAIAVDELMAANGFDYAYYLRANPDVLAAGVDPLLHFQTSGWKEGRNPNALFDTKGYLATYGDVKAAGINPLDHYHFSGWKEGRDPSPGFDSSSYLAAYADVKAAGVDPLLHYLDLGRHEGRSAFADGVWG